MTDKQKEFINHMAVVSALMGDRLLVEICTVIVKRDLNYTIREDNLDVYHVGFISTALCELEIDASQYRVIQRDVMRPDLTWERDKLVGYSFKLTHLKELIDLNKKGD